MLFGFARDRGLPISAIASVNSRTGSPIWAVVFLTVCCFCLGFLLLASIGGFIAVVSIATLGLYISYSIPICCRLTFSRKTFEKGPFHLGRYSETVGWAAVVWVAFITVRLWCVFLSSSRTHQVAVSHIQQKDCEMLQPASSAVMQAVSASHSYPWQGSACS